MSEARFQRVRSLFDRALELPADEREPFLRAESGSDSELLAEVRALLAGSDPGVRPSTPKIDGDGEPDTLEDASRTEVPTQDCTDPRLGQQVGPFRITAALGAGGMGAVYRGWDERLQREVALKVLPERLVRNPEAMRRFEREARALARVMHAHVAVIHGVELGDDDSPWIVQELIEGESLSRRLRKGPLELEEAFRLADQVASALEAVQRRGLVHRDVKPANVQLTPEGEAKLLDFGLAKPSAEESERTDAQHEDVTDTGAAVGTPGYMSPEQLRGEPVDGRTDVWAWGCLLFECLTARRPFRGTSTGGLIAATLEDDPDWERLPTAAPPGLRALLERCLAKDREQRIGGFVELRRVLAEVRGGAELASPVPRKGHLPAELTSFLGREEELAQLERLIDESRLVTLTGTGGAGKTRLALKTAERVRDRFLGGVWFCDLSEARSVEDIGQALATTLDVPLDTEDPITQIAQAITARGRTLVILDNCEHLSNGVAQVNEKLLLACPCLKILATSRHVLGSPGESIYTLGSLSLAIDGPKPGTSEAAELFISRAKTVLRDPWEPSDSDRVLIDEVCSTLDGLPLAIELAAGQLRGLSLSELVSRASSNDSILCRAGTDGSGRQSSLRASLDHGHALLSGDEKTLYRRLGVFEGGWNIDAAEEVCTSGCLPRASVISTLLSLIDKGLVTVTRVELRARYRYLTPIARHARELLLAAGESAELAQGHGDWVDRFGARRFQALRTGDPEAMREVQEEMPNIEAAILRSRDGNPERALRIAVAASWYWLKRGPFRKSRLLLTELLVEAETANPEVRAAAACQASALTLLEGNRRLVERLALQAANESTRGASVWGALARVLRAVVARGEGRFEDAATLLQEARSIALQLGDDWTQAMVLHEQGNYFHDLNQLREAWRSFQQALEIRRNLGDLDGCAMSLNNLALVESSRGEVEERDRLLFECLSLRDGSGDASAIAVLYNLSLSALRANDYALARARLMRVVALSSRVGAAGDECTALVMLARLALQESSVSEASDHLARALSVAEQLHDRVQEATCRRLLARQRLLAGKPCAAVEHLSALLRLDAVSGSELDVLEDVVLVCECVRAHDSRSSRVETSARSMLAWAAHRAKNGVEPDAEIARLLSRLLGEWPQSERCAQASEPSLQSILGVARRVLQQL